MEQKIKPQNINRLLAMGDWHGEYQKAKDVLNQAKIGDKDILICLGDYTDRGADNINCMQLAIDLYNQPNTILLCGNHEDMLCTSFSDVAKYLSGARLKPDQVHLLNDDQLLTIVDTMLNLDSVYTSNGGQATLSNINKDNLHIFRQYLSLLPKLPTKGFINIGDQDFIFAHAGINPKVSFDKQDKFSLLWIREEFYNNYTGDTTVVIGHTPVQCFGYDIPLRHNNILLCDTGSYLDDGKISIVDVLSGHYYQS